MRHILRCLLLAAVVHRAPSAALADASQLEAQKSIARQNLPRLDSFGDPLPEGVHYRLGTVRLRHLHVATMLFSSDGTKLLSHGWTEDLRLWDVASGRLVSQFPLPKDLTGYVHDCRHLIASPDDRYLACVANFRHVVLFDKATANELARWETSCHGLAFSKDNKELIGLSQERTVVRWNIAERKEASRTKLDTAKLTDKTGSERWHLSPDGAVAAFLPAPAEKMRFASWHFWDTTTGNECRPQQQSDISTYRVHWSADGRLLAIVTRKDDIHVWDAVAGKRIDLTPATSAKKRSEGTDGVQSAAFDPGRKLLAVSRLNRVVVWDLDARKQLWEQDVSADALAFSADGKTLAVGGWGAIMVMNAATGERVGFSARDPGHVSLAMAWGWGSAIFCWDGRSFMIYDESGLAQIETTTGKRLRSFDKQNHFSYGGLCNDGRSLIRVADDDKGKAHIFMLDAATGKELWRRPKQPMGIYAAADCKTLAVLSWEEDEFTLLDARTGRELKKLPPPVYRHDGNTCKAFSSDLRMAASGHNSGGVHLWNVDAGKKLRTLDTPPGAGEGTLTFIAGNKQLVWTTTRSKTKEGPKECGCVWDVDTGRKLRSFDAPVHQISSDHRWLALDGDKGIAIRHLQTGRLMTTLAGSFPSADSAPRPLTFSPDGSMVAIPSKSHDEVGVWDTFTGQLVRRFHAPLSYFQIPIFSPDGRALLLSNRGGSSLLVVDVTGVATETGKVPPQQLTSAEADQLWHDLTSTDGPRSHRARWTLVAGGDATIAMLRRRLRPIELPNAKQIAALIASLDSSDFKKRVQSSQALERMESARPALEEALHGAAGLEMKRRIELILSAQENVPWQAELRRELRGVLLLEQIGSPPARKLLQELARGAAGATLTEEAQAALQRLKLSDGTP